MGSFLDKLSDIFPRPIQKGHPFTSAVVLCAGLGHRFGNGTTKQNALLLGIPVAVHTFLAFEKCETVDEVIAVTRPEEAGLFREYKEKYNITKLTKIVNGGDTRQDSSRLGFDATDDRSKYVLIHDGARCLVTPEIIDSTARASYESGAAAAAERSRDTVKIADSDGMISETVDRDKVWLVKTPQAFMANMYRAAAYMAKKDSVAVTDDCMMAERLGFRIKLVDCGSQNLKITFPEDMIIAEAILRSRGAV